MNIEIRPAIPTDVQSIFELIKELAIYEKAPDQVSNTPEALARDLFEKNLCQAIVALQDSEIVGFALYYTSYSTWKGACLYLEDFYVKQDQRRLGIGKLLFDEIVQIAQKTNVKRMDWQVLDWNEPALQFYKKQGAILDAEWVNGRLFFE
ncbi:MAG: GNAT family N-acetyltransferase [Crocinitomicaceae bacterium]|jgi:GNAT superfamily N-acetyltransferase